MEGSKGQGILATFPPVPQNTGVYSGWALINFQTNTNPQLIPRTFFVFETLVAGWRRLEAKNSAVELTGPSFPKLCSWGK